MRGTMLVAFAATALTTACADERPRATAMVEISLGPTQDRASAPLDEKWVGGLLERATWSDSLVAAAQTSNLTQLPAFKEMTETQIGSSMLGSAIRYNLWPTVGSVLRSQSQARVRGERPNTRNASRNAGLTTVVAVRSYSRCSRRISLESEIVTPGSSSASIRPSACS